MFAINLAFGSIFKSTIESSLPKTERHRSDRNTTTIESDQIRASLALYARTWGWTLAACLLATLTFRSVLEIGYRLLSSPKVLVIVFLILAWGVPPVVDAARIEYMREVHGNADYSWLTGCSPPGMLGAIWGPLDIRLWPGLVTQIGVLLLLILVARRARRKELVKNTS